MVADFPQETKEELVSLREKTFAELDRRRRRVSEVDQEIAVVRGKLSPKTLQAKLLEGDTAILQVVVSYRGEMKSALQSLCEKREVLLKDLERASERLNEVNRDLQRLVKLGDRES